MPLAAKPEVEHKICRKGDIFIADLRNGFAQEYHGVRPVIIVQSDRNNQCLHTIVIAPMTSSEKVFKKGYPTQLHIDSSQYHLWKEYSTVELDKVRVIEKIFIKEKIGELNETDLQQLNEILAFNLGIKNEMQEVKKAMNELTLTQKNGIWYADSREVAEMVDKRHADLLETIKGYIEHLLNGNFRSVDFFNPSTYQDGTGRTLLKYDITRKGCDMVANKMTGEKGVLFTAAYVTKFEEMDKQLSKPQSIEDIMIYQLQSIKELKNQVNQQGEQLQAIKETIVYHPENWRDEINKKIDRIARANDCHYKDIRTESYKLLESRAHCDLNERLENLQERKRKAGATATAVGLTNKIEVIEADTKLQEIYEKIVNELLIKYVA
jgi:Rha family phage regulatory protein